MEAKKIGTQKLQHLKSYFAFYSYDFASIRPYIALYLLNPPNFQVRKNGRTFRPFANGKTYLLDRHGLCFERHSRPCHAYFFLPHSSSIYLFIRDGSSSVIWTYGPSRPGPTCGTSVLGQYKLSGRVLHF